jgi:hypothetical protein
MEAPDIPGLRIGHPAIKNGYMGALAQVRLAMHLVTVPIESKAAEILSKAKGGPPQPAPFSCLTVPCRALRGSVCRYHRRQEANPQTVLSWRVILALLRQS